MFYDQTQQNTNTPSIPRSVHHFNSASIEDPRPRYSGKLLETSFVFFFATIMIKTSCGDVESGSPTDNSTGEPD